MAHVILKTYSRHTFGPWTTGQDIRDAASMVCPFGSTDLMSCTKGKKLKDKIKEPATSRNKKNHRS